MIITYPLKLFHLRKTIQRLSFLSAKIKAGNNSKSLKNETAKIIPQIYKHQFLL